jgi:trehalose 6-phosphate phosphatase
MLSEPHAAPLAIFSDFDGTLVEIADAPDRIHVSADLVQRLTIVSRALGGAFAVVSGRALDDLAGYLPDGIAMAGGHGTERRRPDGSRLLVADRNQVRKIAADLEPLVAGHAGLLLEEKPGSVALHFRQAPELADLCHAAMERVLAQHPSFVGMEGKMVIEARPKGVSKAEAIRAFMEEAPFVGRLPLFFGDDVTDEDGFAAVQELGGVGVKVGTGATRAKRRTENVASTLTAIVDLATRSANPKGS